MGSEDKFKEVLEALLIAYGRMRTLGEYDHPMCNCSYCHVRKVLAKHVTPDMVEPIRNVSITNDKGIEKDQ